MRRPSDEGRHDGGPTCIDVPTSVGPARVWDRWPGNPPVGLLVLGHGAGGSVDAPDLSAARDAALGAGWRVVLVEQPYRVAGRRTPPPATWLDAAWVEILSALPGDGGPRGPLVVGGRSSGARVACRTAAQVGADGVLCLAFPWHPPGRPERSRACEVTALAMPSLVVQGDRDPFGAPPQELCDGSGPVRAVLVAGEDHSLRRHPDDVARAVTRWLSGLRSGPPSHG